MAIRHGIKTVLRSLGAYRRLLRAHPFDGAAILAYHGVRADAAAPGAVPFEELHVTASRLASHLQVLRDLDCSFLSLTEWIACASGSTTPPRAVMITFDDGYRSVLTEGLRVLERYDVPAVLFVCTSPVERQVRFWFDAVAQHEGPSAVEEAKSLEYDRWRALVSRLEVPAQPGDPHGPLTIAELQQLARHPLLTIGAHSVSHPILARAPADVQRVEIEGSKSSLERWIGSPVTAFAYPNGRPRVDYSAETRAALQRAGIESAFTVQQAFAQPAANRLEHPRFLVLNTINATELAHRLVVAWPRDGAAAS